MHVMYDMHDPNGSPVEWSYDRSLKCKSEGDSSTTCTRYFEVGTSSVKASDIVRLVNDQAKGWRPWLDELLSVARSLLFCPRTLLLTLIFQCSIPSL